tara:strand:- start:3376 stop:4002 length:627 start_codon:yes stop_codon:yes gene_type:complete
MEKKNIFKALAEFQQEVPVLLKGTDGYGYKYVQLEHIIAQINPILKKHDLGFTQLVEGNGLKTILFHTISGETIESHSFIPECDMKGMNAYQSAGAGITYFRRYALSSMLGIIADADTDAKVYTATPKRTDSKKALNKLIDAFDLEVTNVKQLITLKENDENWERVIEYMNNHPKAKGKSLDKIVKDLQEKYVITSAVKKKLSKHLDL